MFNAIYLTKDNDQFRAELRALDDVTLDANTAGADVTVDIDYSTINYKDGLAMTNKSPVVRKWPMVPGIDCAGTVVASATPAWTVGDKVVMNGWGIGETAWGGLAQRGRYRGDWLVRVPAPLSTRDAMAVGTAGYTAMLACMAIQDAGVSEGDVLVTGASGGVGSFAVAILARRGYRVFASTGKLNEAAYLQQLGASELIDRAELSAAGKPLQKERWAAVVDSVGSHTLANACAQTRYGGAVAACGLAQGMDLPLTVAPFILRGVRLLGIDSVMCPVPRRTTAWQHLAREVDRAQLDAITHEISLGEAIEAGQQILAGNVRGRLVVDVNR
ncbi:MAG TPA: MDR family oxidoreductase [Burkholderiaceae bacterium]|nr:MDR family oxidoreductase [Burkholderiaceae bacterium]